MEPTSRTNRDRVAALLRETGARAAGYWRVERGLFLVQEAFVPCDDLPEEVARGFAEATREVPLAMTSLGIVQAVLDGEPVVSLAAELPAEYGSGRWLRAFGAGRSVAVPVRDDQGIIRGVLSVALAESPPADQAVAALLTCRAQGWVSCE